MTLSDFFWCMFILWIVTLAGGWVIFRMSFRHLTEMKVYLDSIDQRMRAIQKETHQVYAIRKAMQKDAQK